MKLQKIGIGILVVGCAFALAACNKVSNPSSSAPVSGQSSASGQSQDETGAAIITYGDSGFSPAILKAKVGQKIIIKNAGKVAVQFNSDPHPVHTSFPELNLGLIAPGASKTLTLTKAGTYTYHNHIQASQKGTITVE